MATTQLNIGQVVMTRGVAEMVRNTPALYGQLELALTRHMNGDWGDAPPEDKEGNDYAVKNGERVLSAYTLGGERIWILTEWDRSVTTILFPNEY